MLNFTVEAPKYWLNNQSINWNDFNQKNTAIEQKLKSITYVFGQTQPQFRLIATSVNPTKAQLN